eukprot:scaffold46236_cov26-Tisochrysis_lutea.AAC.1
MVRTRERTPENELREAKASVLDERSSKTRKHAHRPAAWCGRATGGRRGSTRSTQAPRARRSAYPRPIGGPWVAMDGEQSCLATLAPRRQDPSARAHSERLVGRQLGRAAARLLPRSFGVRARRENHALRATGRHPRRARPLANNDRLGLAPDGCRAARCRPDLRKTSVVTASRVLDAFASPLIVAQA